MTQYSQEGIEKLKKELHEKETDVRTKIAHRIASAKELGDLSENAEYVEAREAQALNEGRIEEIRGILRTAEIVIPGKRGVISVGSTVVVSTGDIKRELTIVGASEAEPAQGFISNESPIGTAFMGKKKGDEVEVNIPSGKIKYKVVDVK